ncbi:MAG: hypothetical protein Q8P31_05180 [Bacillota bacterium]|nr:hypothetical protein [Bacillota bacterium]
MDDVTGKLATLAATVDFLAQGVDRLTDELRQLKTQVCGEAMDRRIDERVRLVRGQDWRMPEWVPWAIGGLSTICTGLIVYLLTHSGM